MMPVSRADEWVQIATLNEHDQIIFTPQFRALMGELGWEAKAFVGHLLGLWYDPFEHMLDYASGEAQVTIDQPGVFDRNGLDEPQDVVEYWAVAWSQHPNAHQPAHEAGIGLELDADWYRDVLRAKLVSLQMPRRLLEAYRDHALAHIAYWEAYYRPQNEQLRQRLLARRGEQRTDEEEHDGNV
jgi:hypothetical protein